jgi:hypothetical protein
MFRTKEVVTCMKAGKLIPFIVIAAFLALSSITGCTKKTIAVKENPKLEEARAAAENAEKKLSDLKQERMRMEAEKQKKSEEK